MAIDECTSGSATALMCTPDSNHATAAEWRNVCTPTPSTFAALDASSITRSRFRGSVPENCQPKYTFPTLEKGKLTIVTLDSPSYYIASGATAQGIDKDILERFAKDVCLQPNWQVVPSAAVIESVRSMRADIAAGVWYATEERGKIVDQSDPVYVELPTLVAKEAVTNINDLKGKTVGTITGYTWEEQAKTLFGDNLKLYPVLADIRSDASMPAWSAVSTCPT